MPPILKENTPTIKTERLILRKFSEDDVQPMFEILGCKEVNKFLPWLPLKTLDEAKVFLEERYLSHYNKPSFYRYAICLQQNDYPIGYIGLSDNDSHDLGYGLKKEFWHKGIVSEAALAVVERIRNAGYPYITATHDINNPRSGAIMKRLGMSYKYSYEEQWEPKNTLVIFRMYQLNFDGNNDRTYMKYWNMYENHFIEDIA